MSDLIAVTGNLTSAPERKEVSGGVTLVTFGLASNERRQENGVWVDGHTNYYNVAVFRGLAEHALRSLQKGQRVIVVGKLKLKQWEANGRTGTNVDLEASSLGPDLKFGTAMFVKDGDGASTPEAPRAESPEWATRTPGVDPGGEPGSDRAPVEARAETPELVATGGWATPGEEATPY